MINVIELRIGNFVYSKTITPFSQVGVCKVENIQYDGINKWQDMGASGYVKQVEMTPIPITPDTINHCGFTKLGGGYYITALDGVSIDISFPEGRGIIIELGSAALPCKYIHQLQNLYYSLTGKDLEINWSEQ